MPVTKHVSQPRVLGWPVRRSSAAAQFMVANAPNRVRGLAVLDGVYAGEWAMEAIASIQEWKKRSVTGWLTEPARPRR